MVGQNATLKIPEIYQGPRDPRNLLVVIINIEIELYQVGCKEGYFPSKYSAADLDPVSENLLKVENIPGKN